MIIAENPAGLGCVPDVPYKHARMREHRRAPHWNRLGHEISPAFSGRLKRRTSGCPCSSVQREVLGHLCRACQSVMQPLSLPHYHARKSQDSLAEWEKTYLGSYGSPVLPTTSSQCGWRTVPYPVRSLRIDLRSTLSKSPQYTGYPPQNNFSWLISWTFSLLPWRLQHEYLVQSTFN